MATDAFQTPRNTACAARIAVVVGLPGPASVRTVPVVRSAELSSVLRAAARPPTGPPEDVVVLFYAASCRWSIEMWPAWVRAVRAFDNLCLVAIDAYEDHALNNNIGVYGFPTILRFRAEVPDEKYSGDRSFSDLATWIVTVTGVPPDVQDLSDPVLEPQSDEMEHFSASRNMEERLLAMRAADIVILDFSKEVIDSQIDWALLGSVFISLSTASWWLTQWVRNSSQKRRQRRHAEEDDTGQQQPDVDNAVEVESDDGIESDAS